MRISDWSSDVCSSDLHLVRRTAELGFAFDANHTLGELRVRLLEHAWKAQLAADNLHVARMQIGKHTSELQSLMRISYAVFCLKKKTNPHNTYIHTNI